MRWAGLQHDVVIRSATDTIGALLQPLKPDQAEPAIGSRHPSRAIGTPFVDALCIVVRRNSVGGGIGMHEGYSSTQNQSGQRITPHGVCSARCKKPSVWPSIRGRYKRFLTTA